MPTLAFSAFFDLSVKGDISDFVFGVFKDTRFVGLQYSFLPPAPHGLPVRVSTHFSFSQRFSAVPDSVFLTEPDCFLHLAMACDALADGKTSY